MASPVAIRDGPRASSKHYSLVNPFKTRPMRKKQVTHDQFCKDCNPRLSEIFPLPFFNLQKKMFKINTILQGYIVGCQG